MTEIRNTLVDGLNVARRNVIRIRRVPEILIAVLVQPIVMVVLFAYVFGGSIDIPGGSYREYLVGGIFAMTVTFGATFTGAGLAEDMQRGIIDRFRSLPMSRSAVVFGRTASDVVYNVLSLAVMALAGLAVGWRISSGVGDALLGFGTLLAFSYGLSWVMAYIGLIVPAPEAVSHVSFMALFPLTFVANTFVPSDDLPTPLRIFAEWNPVSAVTQAARDLFGNIPAAMPAPTAWPLQHPVLYTLLWSAAGIVVFAPLAVRRYSRTGA